MKIPKSRKPLRLLCLIVLLFLSTVYSVDKIISINNTFAITHAIPEGYETFSDAVLYDCVVNAFLSIHPETDISNGLSDEQLLEITSLSCDGSPDNHVTDTKGIEKMASLAYLRLYSDSFEDAFPSIDLSNNTELISLELISRNLDSIDLTYNKNLVELEIIANLSSIDLSQNTKLTKLNLLGNRLTSIDLRYNTSLSWLDLISNQLSSIDLSYNTELTEVYLEDNKLTIAEFFNNEKLEILYIDQNNLEELHIENNYRLSRLMADSNNLAELDLSGNPELYDLRVDDVSIWTGVEPIEGDPITFDLKDINFIDYRYQQIPETENYVFDSDTKILAIKTLPETEFMQVRVTGLENYRIKLELPSYTPDDDPDEPSDSGDGSDGQEPDTDNIPENDISTPDTSDTEGAGTPNTGYLIELNMGFACVACSTPVAIIVAIFSFLVYKKRKQTKSQTRQTPPKLI